MSSKSAVIPFLVGAGAGAALALLFAPQSGAATRARIQDGVDEAGSQLGEAGEYLRRQAERLNSETQVAIERGRKQVEGVLTHAAKTVTSTLKQAGDVFSANLDKASAAVDSAVSHLH